MRLILVWLVNDHLALQEAINSQTNYINVLVVHKDYVQEWFDYIRNVKTLWLVTVPKNVANFDLIYDYLIWQKPYILNQNYMYHFTKNEVFHWGFLQ